MKRGLYIHIPFCRQKCYYCDFASFSGKEPQIDSYLQALAKEAATHRGKECQTLYVGGGTPSLLSVSQIRTLGDIITQNFGRINCFAESTFEANPESLTPDKIETLRLLGFNRLSMGLQSFNEHELRVLGRIHNVAQFMQAYQRARSCGFKNINVDLIAGFPQQTLTSFTQSLEHLLALEPQHISVYGLQVEEGTRFFEQGIVCNQALMRCMLEKAHDYLTQAGYHHYEISNFALPGKEAQHNTHYWHNGEYIGLGSAAASYENGTRRQNVSCLETYITRVMHDQSPVDFAETLQDKAREGETLLLAFRQLDGVELTAKQQDLFGAEIERHIQKGLLTRAHKKVKLTKEGLYMANEVFRSFVAPFEDA